MTNYIFQPCPNFGISEHAFTTWTDAFSDEEVKRLVAYGDAKVATDAVLGDSRLDAEYRRSKVAWLDTDPEIMWMFDRMAYVARSLNGQFYRFDLYGFGENFQYTTYHADELGHYDWHQDGGIGHTGAPRKLSMVLQLSDPADYEGGDLEIMSQKKPVQVTKQKGLVAVFPSYMMHRVTPVTSGTRRTLVAWITGPAFR